MPAELIVVNGPSAGVRYALGGADEMLIGRAPNAGIVLNEAEVGWRHCQVARRGDRYAVSDLRSAGGTFVNGMRSAERWLEDRDQIGIGKTILMFRSAATSAEPPPAAVDNRDAKPLLLAACSLVFLFRAVAASAGNTRTTVLQRQILRIIFDLMPSDQGFLLLGGTVSELVGSLREDSPQSAHFENLVHRLASDGATTAPELRSVGVPLYLNGCSAGAAIIQIREAEAGRLAFYLDTLTAIASLASIAFEANHEVETLKAERALLQEQITGPSGIVGKSAPVRRMLDLVDRVAPRDTTVLITGESGTGKELIARALHDKSSRREHPFIAVNCAALSESLFESELFGHEKGAFTGAISLKRGRFELAQGGTIFLDEVGELALPLQAKLLRVLQQREFERVGGMQVLPLDIRVIAATNRDLALDVREGKFREDLYHRLNVVCLQSPPLRERRDDIPLLARHFLQRSSQRCKRQVSGLSPEAEDLLVQYSWPGNVRELENSMERAVVLGVSDLVLVEDLPETLLEAAPDSAGTRYHSSVGQAKREAILDAYVQGSGDYKQAAKVLGLHPNYLLRLVRNLSLRDDINRAMAMGAASR
jgi:two-component system, NtrC family, response regulator HydG